MLARAQTKYPRRRQSTIAWLLVLLRRTARIIAADVWEADKSQSTSPVLSATSATAEINPQTRELLHVDGQPRRIVDSRGRTVPLCIPSPARSLGFFFLFFFLGRARVRRKAVPLPRRGAAWPRRAPTGGPRRARASPPDLWSCTATYRAQVVLQVLQALHCC